MNTLLQHWFQIRDLYQILEPELITSTETQCRYKNETLELSTDSRFRKQKKNRS